ncbi:MAG: hypothetical protein V1744_00355 [Candidatus Altiarchaeota archaeon]
MGYEMDFKRVAVYCALIGLFVGVVAAIPIVRLPNVCCLWIIVGGFAAAYVSGRNMKIFELADGAIVGAVFGLLYGITDTIAILVVNMVFDLFGLGLAVRGVNVGGVAALLNIQLKGVVWTLLSFVITTVEGVIFGAVGGVLYATLRGSEKNGAKSVRTPTLKRR